MTHATFFINQTVHVAIPAASGTAYPNSTYVPPVVAEITSFTLSGDQVTLGWSAFAPAGAYRIESSTTLAENSWEPLDVTIPAGTTTATFPAPTQQGVGCSSGWCPHN